MSQKAEPRRLIVALTGSTSIILGIRLLQVLEELGIERHLIMSTAAKQVVVAETDYRVQDIEALATRVYGFNDPTAAVASGGMRTMGMAVVPCTMKTLGGIASGSGDNTTCRAAEVTLKERRRLVLVARETPLSMIDIQNMLKVTEAGAVVLPPVLPFYNRPKNLETVIDHLVGKVLDMFGVEHDLYHRWMGIEEHAERHGLVVHRVRDVMTRDVLVTDPATTVLAAARQMTVQNRGSIVVVEAGAPVAIVTEKDLFKKVVAKGQDPKGLAVKDIMSSPLVSIGPDESLRAAARLMIEKEIRRLPVIDGDSLVGIITAADLAKLDPHELL
ncbi:MAG TPA: UbiX family flavin prenyltransferase [Nitrososphaerales archaeon]|nr:UbiX family flavin prenyltransferase [Nitrososphaerales archaeon]HUK75335.1 UbiX family flavin prenyltransferase [Nitrososphaerales archaeon]